MIAWGDDDPLPANMSPHGDKVQKGKLREMFLAESPRP